MSLVSTPTVKPQCAAFHAGGLPYTPSLTTLAPELPSTSLPLALCLRPRKGPPLPPVYPCFFLNALWEVVDTL